MYVVKLKHKDSLDVLIASVVNTYSEAELVRNDISLKAMSMDYEEALKIVKHHAGLVAEGSRWTGDPGYPIEYISIVQLSRYAPHAPTNVVLFRQFK